MKKGFCFLFLVAVSGFGFGQTIQFTVTDANGPGSSQNVGDQLTFSNTTVPGTCPTLTYVWNFGVDATPATSTSATTQNVIYSSSGTKSVNLRATETNAGFPPCNGQVFNKFQDVIISERGTPVVLSEQMVSLKNNLTIISWSTYSEFNNDFFEVQRAIDGVNFETIGQIEGKGSTKITQYYSFEDNAPLAGVSYYRIVQYDLNGSTNAFSVLSVKNLKNNLSLVNISPNPVNTTASIQFEAKVTGTVEVKVIDIMGKTVIQEIIQTEKGINSLSLPFDNLSKGMYQVILSDGINTTLDKIIKN